MFHCSKALTIGIIETCIWQKISEVCGGQCGVLLAVSLISTRLSSLGQE